MDPDAEPSNEPSNDASTDPLVRQLYWQHGSTPRAALGTEEIRERLVEFTAQMRTDEQATLPYVDDARPPPTGWRRYVKFRLFRMLRPMSMRYDRLLGDLADLATGLAERLAAAEGEIERLRRRPEHDDEAPAR